jgi:hypothetical protein
MAWLSIAIRNKPAALDSSPSVHAREPLPDQDFEFVNAVFGGAISSNFMPAIEKGCAT